MPQVIQRDDSELNRDIEEFRTTEERVSLAEKRMELFDDEAEGEETKEPEPPKDKLFDTLTIQREENAIQAKERELMLKAKQLENEMLAIRKAKVDSVLRQFEQQLQRDAQLEQNRIKEQLHGEYEKQVNRLEAEKSSNMGEIEKLQKQVIGPNAC